MVRVDLSVLLEKMGAISKLALEEAASLCISRQNKEVGVLHFLYALLESPLSDVRIFSKKNQINYEELKLDISRYFPQEKSLEGYPVFSPLLIDAFQDAWLLSTTELNQSELRSGAIFLAILLQAERYLPFSLMEKFAFINREAFRRQFEPLLQESAESSWGNHEDEASVSSRESFGENVYLQKYTTNITQLAEDGALDPVLARDEEIHLMIDILSRRRKNNPIVVGDAGVGKSALIEGLAQKIVAGKVPEKLQNVSLLVLDLGLLQAGASVKGEFEKRLKGIIEEVKASSTPIILFIDEAHTLIGAGNQEGGGDAANLLKPALARGELRTIAATTWREYKKYFEKDPALSRRFQLVVLDEPSIDGAINIMRGLRSVYETSHQVFITDEALISAVKLSNRYISGRQLPDKAIDVLDTACARIAINLHVPPLKLTQLENKLEQLNLEEVLIKREIELGKKEYQERFSELLADRKEVENSLAILALEWESQKELIHDIITLRSLVLSIEAKDCRETVTKILMQKESELLSISDEELLVHSRVDKKQIASVIADWTGVPINEMDKNELVKITELPEILTKSIKGQKLALDTLHQHLLTSRADLRKEGRPKGAFLLVGPSGVGKTETALQIAELLYGGKQFLTTINMSEFQEKHTVSKLLGSPPGYIGYGEGGILTEAIRQKPYSVVLLDEVEKAHPEVLNIFYQAFDKGEIADGEGRLIDCQNVLFFLTSNLGFQTIVDYVDEPEAMRDELYQELTTFFQPALLARMEIIPYIPLDDVALQEIIGVKLYQLRSILVERYNADVLLSDSLIDEIRKRAIRNENGARMIESIIEGQLLPSLSLKLLKKLASRESIESISLSASNDAFQCDVV